MISFTSIFLIFLAISLYVIIDDPALLLGMNHGYSARLIFGAVIVSLVAVALVLNARLRETPVRIVTAWFATAAAIILASANFFPLIDFDNLGDDEASKQMRSTDLTQSSARASAPSEVEILAAANGNFYTGAEFNGELVDVIIDTGASYVTLTHTDAENSGLDPSNLTYSINLRTANGTPKGALTQLDDVTIAGITVNNVDVVVTEPGVLGISLLGMSYLSRISGFSVKEGRMVLSD